MKTKDIKDLVELFDKVKPSKKTVATIYFGYLATYTFFFSLPFLAIGGIFLIAYFLR